MRSQHSAMTLGSAQENVEEENMLKMLLGAAAMAAVACAAVPASAAKLTGCSAENLERTEFATEAMADGASKTTAHREIAQAQQALLDSKMDACAVHLSRAIQAGALYQASYGSAMNQAPSQSQWQWAPVKPAL
jgi:hypothetical protein